jgi:DNA-binding NtrC family response regulator
MERSSTRVLVVDDEKDFCEILFVLLKTEGFEPMVAHNGEVALDMIGRGLPDAVLLDMKMPGIDGTEVLKRAKEAQPNLPVLIMTAYGGIGGAVEAMRQGASDYLVKPLDNRRLIGILRRVIQETKHLRTVPDDSADHQKKTVFGLREIMGPSDAISKVINDIVMVAGSDFTVIIQGETGTGKELVARAIHRTSQKARAPLIPLDCGAIPEALFES